MWAEGVDVTNRIPRVTVLGSCRVWTPFKLLADAGDIQLQNAGVYGFVHYAKEVVQQLRVMNASLRIPRGLTPYITHKQVPVGDDDMLDTGFNDLRDTDILVVEISSLKEIEFEGFYLQINRLREQLVRDRPTLITWWKELYEKDVSRPRREYLSNDMVATERNIVVWTDVTIQDQASLVRDMTAIRSFFGGPVLWVSHFDTPTFEGAPIPIRNDLVRFVRDSAEALEDRFFNPRPLIEAFGMRRALQDLAHYTPEFETLLAHWLRDYELDALMAELSPSTSARAPVA
jgi:hypothetical protein